MIYILDNSPKLGETRFYISLNRERGAIFFLDSPKNDLKRWLDEDKITSPWEQ